jgi:hypothetical protein
MRPAAAGSLMLVVALLLGAPEADAQAFPTVSVVDNFNRANGALTLPWENNFFGAGQLEVNNNAARSGHSTNYRGSRWSSGGTIGPDLEVFATIAEPHADGRGMNIDWRTSTTSDTRYILSLQRQAGSNNDALQVEKVLNGFYSTVGAAIPLGFDFTAGDGVGIRMVASTLTVYYKRAGGAWTALASRTDTSIRDAGRVTFYIEGQPGKWDDVGIGTYTADGEPPPPPPAGQWSAGPALPYFPVHAHLLPTGVVLLWPGDEGISGNDPRVWDPASGEIRAVTAPGYDIFCAGHAYMADGRLFVAGGHLRIFVGVPTASLYDPATDRWSLAPDMNAGRWYPTVTPLSNGDMLVVSGSIDDIVGVNNLPQVFEVATGSWRSLTNARLNQDLYPQMLLAPNGRVFNPGPSATTRYLDTAGAGTWTVVGTRPGGYRDYGSAVMYADGKVLVMGGGDPPTSTAEVIDLNAPSPAWRAVGSMEFPRRQLNALLLPDGSVLVTGGTSGSGFNNETAPVYAAELWDPLTEQWTTLASAAIPRLYHSATLLLRDGRVLSTGGNGYPQAEIFSPPYLFKGARPTITSAPSQVSYGETFFVATPDAAAITGVTWLRLSSVTHAFNANQRINRLSFSAAAGGLNVVAPGSPTLAPPGDYMLFLLNEQGTPSVAAVMRVHAQATAVPPAITSLIPSSATAGGAPFTLTVSGSGFVPGSTVRWEGTARTTTFVSASQLTAAIPGSDIVTPGTASVTVTNPDAGGVSNSMMFTITPPPGSSFALRVSKSGNGTVSSAPAGINCGSTCTATYPSGTQVTLTATPGRNQQFVGWSGACTGTAATCTVTMDADKSVGASFKGGK